ncbi:cell division protein DivIVA [Mycobacterium asiaticum]|uniref:Cell division protein DivIVA n=1 Tax=Mycobacterium asiaticum TaxID=1790 RepID=A0A1A3CFN8_MYCAS|nr:cell division protein DivIVA [Mycobacterium asiaticum]
METLIAKQQLLRDDVENLRARLRESGDEVAALRKEVAQLTETSSSPHAVQQRMAKMLRSAVDEVSQMQAEARAEAEELIAAAEAEADAERRRHEEQVAEMVAQQKAMQAENEEARKKLDEEMADLRAETRAAVDEAWRNAQQERDQLLADAKQQADFEREQAQRAVDEARAQRIRILEQLMAVYRDLDAVPAALEKAYADAQATTAAPTDEKVSTG